MDNKTIEENKKLCERYPFLVPKNRFTKEVVKDYDYSFTELDSMEKGWRKRFGMEMLEEIREALIRVNYLDKYMITEIKEKYGSLRWYDNGAPEEVYDIIKKYSHISEHVCIHCGAMPVPLIDDGWICPYCKDCYKEKLNRIRNLSKDKKDYTDEEVDEIYKSVIYSKNLMRKQYGDTINKLLKKKI